MSSASSRPTPNSSPSTLAVSTSTAASVVNPLPAQYLPPLKKKKIMFIAAKNNNNATVPTTTNNNPDPEKTMVSITDEEENQQPSASTNNNNNNNDDLISHAIGRSLERAKSARSSGFFKDHPLDNIVETTSYGDDGGRRSLRSKKVTSTSSNKDGYASTDSTGGYEEDNEAEDLPAAPTPVQHGAPNDDIDDDDDDCEVDEEIFLEDEDIDPSVFVLEGEKTQDAPPQPNSRPVIEEAEDAREEQSTIAPPRSYRRRSTRSRSSTSSNSGDNNISQSPDELVPSISTTHSSQQKQKFRKGREILRDWLLKHADDPYPTDEEKERLAKQIGFSVIQVHTRLIAMRFAMRQKNMMKKGNMNEKKNGNKHHSDHKQNQALINWLLEHSDYPYPTAEEKEQLAKQTGLTVIQVHARINAARFKLRQENKMKRGVRFDSTQNSPGSLLNNSTSSSSSSSYDSDNSSNSSGSNNNNSRITTTPTSLGSGRAKGAHLNQHQKEVLTNWLHAHADHPYPSDEDKERLARELGLSPIKVHRWFINARRSLKLSPAKAIECMEESCESSSSSSNNNNNTSPYVGSTSGTASSPSSSMSPAHTMTLKKKIMRWNLENAPESTTMGRSDEDSNEAATPTNKKMRTTGPMEESPPATSEEAAGECHDESVAIIQGKKYRIDPAKPFRLDLIYKHPTVLVDETDGDVIETLDEHGQTVFPLKKNHKYRIEKNVMYELLCSAAPATTPKTPTIAPTPTTPTAKTAVVAAAAVSPPAILLAPSPMLVVTNAPTATIHTKLQPQQPQPQPGQGQQQYQPQLTDFQLSHARH